MTTRSEMPQRYADDVTQGRDGTEPSIHERAMLLRRRLNGVPLEQLAEERRTRQRRDAVIEARKRPS